MDRPESTSSVRRYPAYVGTLGTTQLYFRNPFVIACASAASFHSSDGLSLLDLPIILATLFCLFACIYSFLLSWGIIGIVVGFSLGQIINLIIAKKHNYNIHKIPKTSEDVLIIMGKDKVLENLI